MIAADQCLCPTDKFVIGKGLYQIVVPTAGKSQHLIIFLGFGTQKKNRRVAVLSDLHTGLIAVHPQHHDIQDDQVKSIFCRSLDRLLAICRLGHLISLAPQKKIDDLPDLRIVIHHQNMGSRRLPLFFHCPCLYLAHLSLLPTPFSVCICLQYNNFLPAWKKIKKTLEIDPPTRDRKTAWSHGYGIRVFHSSRSNVRPRHAGRSYRYLSAVFH